MNDEEAFQQPDSVVLNIQEVLGDDVSQSWSSQSSECEVVEAPSKRAFLPPADGDAAAGGGVDTSEAPAGIQWPTRSWRGHGQGALPSQVPEQAPSTPLADPTFYGGQHFIEFEASLEKGADGLGIDVQSGVADGPNADTLLITRIKIGAIMMWNRVNPENPIQVGDRIGQVNGVRGLPSEMIQVIKNTKLLRIRFLRLVEFTVSVNTYGRLGIDIAQHAHSLRVLSVGHGPIGDWNARQTPDFEVRAGDHIVEANGVRGKCDTILKTIKQHAVTSAQEDGEGETSELQLVFIRGPSRVRSRARRADGEEREAGKAPGRSTAAMRNAAAAALLSMDDSIQKEERRPTPPSIAPPAGAGIATKAPVAGVEGSAPAAPRRASWLRPTRHDPMCASWTGASFSGEDDVPGTSGSNGCVLMDMV